MVDEDLIKYIKKKKKDGYSKAELKQRLVSKGWDKREISEAIDYLEEKEENSDKSFNWINDYKLIWFLTFLLLIMLSFFVYMNYPYPNIVDEKFEQLNNEYPSAFSEYCINNKSGEELYTVIGYQLDYDVINRFESHYYNKYGFEISEDSFNQSSYECETIIDKDVKVIGEDTKINLPTNRIKANKSEQIIQEGKIQNIESNPKNLTIKVQIKSGNITQPKNIKFRNLKPKIKKEKLKIKNKQFNTKANWDKIKQNIRPNQVKDLKIRIHSPNKKGNYLYRIKIINTETKEAYAAKSFFIKTNNE